MGLEGFRKAPNQSPSNNRHLLSQYMLSLVPVPGQDKVRTYLQ